MIICLLVLIKRMHDKINFDGGFKLEEVTDLSGKDIDYTINETMMRIDLSKSLKKVNPFPLK